VNVLRALSWRSGCFGLSFTGLDIAQRVRHGGARHVLADGHG